MLIKSIFKAFQSYVKSKKPNKKKHVLEQQRMKEEQVKKRKEEKKTAAPVLCCFLQRQARSFTATPNNEAQSCPGNCG